MTFMVHLVAGFPTKQAFTEAVQALYDGGAEILEIQIPFSDPTADGPAITAACEFSIHQGFKVQEIFDHIAIAKHVGFKRIMVMTYANIVFRYGIEKYIQDMHLVGVEGLIVPDFPLEDEERFYALALKHKIMPVPVAVVGMPKNRIALLQNKRFTKVYVALRSGITGENTVISPEVQDFLSMLLENYEVYGGFGIANAQQVKALRPFVHAVVVGSYFTRAIHKAFTAKTSVYESVKTALADLQ
jgi:tryptophan synthase alpha chain